MKTTVHKKKSKTKNTMSSLKKEFPILSRKIHGKPLVYLDNAATSQKPQIVIDALVAHYQKHNANIHRAVHTLSEEATLAYEEAHVVAAEFINARSWREIIFTKNATESLNLLAYSLGEQLKEGDEIIISIMEHHSNFVPWQQVALRKKAKLVVIGLDQSRAHLDLQQLGARLNKKTRIVSLTHVSNVLGTINPIEEIIKLVRQKSPHACIIVDASQSAPHLPLDVQKMDCDFLVFTGHKVYGPTGVGVLYGKEKLLAALPPFLTGGDMIAEVRIEKTTWNDLPWKFEAGTPPIAEAAALAAALRFVQQKEWPTIVAHEKKLMSYAIAELKRIQGVTILGSKSSEERVAVISFTIEGIHSHDLASLLDAEGVAIRSGHHCAQPLLTSLGLHDCARISCALYNDRSDINRFIAALLRAREVFR